jgi:molybdate transport system ATP-binding protein
VLTVDIIKKFGGFSLQAQFSVQGGITTLFGRSGAGKTTLANAIAGLIIPDGGNISVGGRILFDAGKRINVPVHQRRLGYVFQDARLFPHLTVRRNLSYGSFFNRGARGFADFDHIVDLLGLMPLLDRRPARLSGGEKQRVAIGRALLANPLMLIMDEPLASLDRARRGEILPYIERLRDETSLPIIYVSHALEEVTRLADNMVLLSEGKVCATGSPEDIMSRLDLVPLTGRYEAGSVLEAKVVAHDAHFQLTRVQVGNGEFFVPLKDQDLPVGANVRLRIRARDVAIALNRTENLSIRNMLTATVTEMRAEVGPFMEIRLDVGGSFLLARITRMSAEALALAEGTQVYALIKTVAIDRHFHERR